MKLKVYSGYIGKLIQPLQVPERDRPTMFMMADSLKTELDLIILNPESYLHAYKFIIQYRPKRVRLFFPSLRMDFISDAYNLYHDLLSKIDVKVVFPKPTGNVFFDYGCINTDTYVNEFNSRINVRYIPNNNLDDIYDIVVNTDDSSNYFVSFLTREMVDEFIKNRDYTIHLPYSSSMYGGLTYVDLDSLRRKDKRLFYPHSFSSVEEYYAYNNRELPVELDKFHDDPDEESGFPEDYEGDITDDEIMEMMFGKSGE